MTDKELSDREVIEITAELCGLEIEWRSDLHVSEWFAYIKPVVDDRRWNPLTDANQAWQVLEAVRERANSGVNDETWLMMIREMSDAQSDLHLLLTDFHFSDIPRAAAAAVKTQEPSE